MIYIKELFYIGQKIEFKKVEIKDTNYDNEQSLKKIKSYLEYDNEIKLLLKKINFYLEIEERYN